MQPKKQLDINVSGQWPVASGQKKTASGIARGVFLSADDVRHAAEKMLKKAGIQDGVLSIVFLDGRAMRRLNRESLGHDYVTDVITFDLGGETLDVGRKTSKEFSREAGALHGGASRLTSHVSRLTIDGEIYICPAEARRNARLYGEPLEREILRYVAHGILHLLGHDDHSAADRERMRALEDKLLTLNS